MISHLHEVKRSTLMPTHTNTESEQLLSSATNGAEMSAPKLSALEFSIRARIAAESEKKVIALLEDAQLLLKAGSLEAALIKLTAARDARKHPEQMQNLELSRDTIFDESIKELNKEISEYNDTKLNLAKLHAEEIVKMALLIDGVQSRLFIVHKDRLIEQITQGLRLNWAKFYKQPAEKLAIFFRHIADLVNYDFINNDFNKRLFRGGFFDQFQLGHSKTLGPVIQAMLQLEPVGKVFQLELPIFEKTKTRIEIMEPQDTEISYNWRCTLEQWPTLVLNSTIVDTNEAPDAFGSPKSASSDNSNVSSFRM